MIAKLYYGSFTQVRNQINNDEAICRIDQHLNSAILPSVNYCLTEIRSGDLKSLVWAQDLANIQSKRLGIKNSGVRQLTSLSRGYTIVKNMNCPVLINESCFISNPDGADLAKSEVGQEMIANCVVDSIRKNFSDGLVALVPGHAHKQTNDKGARAYGGGFYESDATLPIIRKVSEILNRKENDMPAFQATPSQKTEKEVWYDGLFTGRGDWGLGRVFMIVRIDPDKVGGKFQYIIIPKDKTKPLKWSDPIMIEPDNRPFEVEFPQNIGNFSLHIKGSIPILTAVNQMY